MTAQIINKKNAKSYLRVILDMSTEEMELLYKGSMIDYLLKECNGQEWAVEMMMDHSMFQNWYEDIFTNVIVHLAANVKNPNDHHGNQHLFFEQMKRLEDTYMTPQLYDQIMKDIVAAEKGAEISTMKLQTC
jgi:hypothetical protein